MRMIRGNPKKSDSWDIGEENIRINRNKSFFVESVEFRVKSYGFESSIEFLLSQFLRSPDSIRFGVDYDNFLVLFNNEYEIGRLGEMSSFVSKINFDLFLAEKIDIELNTVPEIIDSNGISRLFDMEDYIDDLVDSEFDELMNNLDNTFGIEVYSVKMGIKKEGNELLCPWMP